MGQIKNTPFSLGSIVPKIIDCYSGNQNDARNQKIHSEVMDNFFEVKLSFLTGVSQKCTQFWDNTNTYEMNTIRKESIYGSENNCSNRIILKN